MISNVRMARRTLLAAGAMLALMSVPAVAGDVSAVHGRALVLDGHVDVLLPGTNARYYAPDGRSYTELDKLKAGGVDALVYAVAVSTGRTRPRAMRPLARRPTPSWRRSASWRPTIPPTSRSPFPPRTCARSSDREKSRY